MSKYPKQYVGKKTDEVYLRFISDKRIYNT